MGRDTLKDVCHAYYWGRMDRINWTEKDDENLLEEVRKKLLTTLKNVL